MRSVRTAHGASSHHGPHSAATASTVRRPPASARTPLDDQVGARQRKIESSSSRRRIAVVRWNGTFPTVRNGSAGSGTDSASPSTTSKRRRRSDARCWIELDRDDAARLPREGLRKAAVACPTSTISSCEPTSSPQTMSSARRLLRRKFCESPRRVARAGRARSATERHREEAHAEDRTAETTSQ